jgi:hypothetical protein
VAVEENDDRALRGLDEPEGAPAPVRSRLRWWREVIYIIAFYVVYSAVRNTFGSNGNGGHVEVSIALGHARDIIKVERFFGLFFEHHLQDWYLGLASHGLIRFWNIYYGSAHFVISALALVWLFRRDKERYPVWRNTLAITTGLALIGFASFSLMPPRLLDYCGEYGGCWRHYGFVDTLRVYGGLWSFGSGAMKDISNQYAAMPSLHIAWSTWTALVIWPMVRRPWAKVLVVLYPVATLFCILVTANHYWIDGVGGLVVLGVGYLLGSRLARFNDRRHAARVSATV